jgi:predicted ATPase
MFSQFEIKKYKSLFDVSIKSPSNFSVFVGPNASGKSTLFETLDFINTSLNYSKNDTLRLFGGFENILSRKAKANDVIRMNLVLKNDLISITIEENNVNWETQPLNEDLVAEEPFVHYGKITTTAVPFISEIPLSNFSRLFINNNSVEKIEFKDDQRLSTGCGNLEKVLKRVLKNKLKREELIEWLALFIPGFEDLKIQSEKLSGTDHLLIYEKGNKKPFARELISDGTFNIIALLTAVFQSDEPQFLCIEEPENGLNPKVVKQFVEFFRQQCKEKGHYIWLNTHSQTLVRELTTEEIIIVDKIDGETRVKQIQGMNLHGLKMDEALLSNAIGGGIPW